MSTASVGNQQHMVKVIENGDVFHTHIERDGDKWASKGEWASVKTKGGAGEESGHGLLCGCAGTADRSLHVVVNKDGNIFHSIRNQEGAWQKWGDVKGVSGDRGFIVNVAVAGIGNDVHVVVMNNKREAFHTARGADGNWQKDGFQPLTPAMKKKDIGELRSVTCMATGEGLHVGAVPSDGKFYHALRDARGAWDGWNEVPRKLPKPGLLILSACEGDVVHYSIVAEGKEVHSTGRDANGGWLELKRVTKDNATPDEDLLDPTRTTGGRSGLASGWWLVP